MSWLLFAVLSIVTYSITNLIKRVIMKEDHSDPIVSSVYFQLICAVLVGIFAFWKGFILPPITQYPLNFAISAVLYGLGTTFSFKALQSIESSEYAILFPFEVVVTIIASIYFLHEPFGLSRLIGTILILMSIFLVAEKIGKISLKKGSLYVLAAASVYGLAVPNDAFLLRYSDVTSYTSIMFALPALVILILNPKATKKLQTGLDRKYLNRMIALCALYSVSAVAFYYALVYGAKASQLTPINQSTTILTVILGAIFLKERDHLFKKLIAAILVIVGVIFLT